MTTEIRDPAPPPVEVLIPEARQHQRRRYVLIGLGAAVSALVVASLIVAGLVLFSGPPAGGRSRPPATVPAAAVAASHLYFRPVLCDAPPYRTAGAPPVTATRLSCDAASSLTASHLNVDPSTGTVSGFSTNSVPIDGGLATVPTTTASADKPAASVVLPVFREPGERMVLGPSEMSNRLIESASVSESRDGQWVVDYTMSSAGAALWDKVAWENFHQLIGIDLDGVVVSAPIIQPTQSSFTSFDGKGEVSGNLSHAEATKLARAMHPSRR